ncbi:MAG: tripartite tricarboxylate transporter TctB family protein [Spirochaetaceae bacterium]|nr:MAG: tripartite tricarboxylate transporter TctB family protein [Spirochaetaceae bacterium]
MRNDRLTALVLIAVSIFSLLESNRYGPLSRLFPRVVAVALGVLSLVLLVQSIVRARPGYRQKSVGLPSASGAEPAETGSSGDMRGMLFSLLVMVAWTLLLEPVGFWAASVLAFSTLVLILRTPGKTVVWKNILGGAILVTMFVLVFRIALRVPLPEGLLW